MPNITINGKKCEFQNGQMILQVALDNGLEIPHYCYHPGMSIVASCRICLAEVWAPNPRNDNKLEPIPKLLPTCQTSAAEGQVVYTDSPKSIANQKSVMEYLLINHPVDCPVCDQAGECYLQDYSYQFGRGVSRFREEKIKQPKKDLGPHVLLYADRCIMCSRCVRFCREVTGTSEIVVQGRGAYEEIDVFPGLALDNELSANVIDLCPVGALLDKDFLFQQRVWYLTNTPSIDGITASGDNIWIDHNNGVVYRVKPRTNLDVNKWWITDEVRYGWKFVHDENRLTLPGVKGEQPFEAEEAAQAYETAYARIIEQLGRAKRAALMVSPMLSCEDAYWLARLVRQAGCECVFGLGPVPVIGANKTFPGGFTVHAEKAPNARGVRRVLKAFDAPGGVLEADAMAQMLARDNAVDTVIIVGGYPAPWISSALAKAVRSANRFVAIIDILPNELTTDADVVLPSATWAEKAGTFESATNRLQAFDRAIAPIDFAKSESQLAIDMIAAMTGDVPGGISAAETRMLMADTLGLREFVTDVHLPPAREAIEPDMQIVEL
jgi:NADH-quinone oxidoreductase subunit G